jgi:glycosyltransferase involved in cell wall biosynthesis
VPGVPVPTDLPLVATLHDLTPIMFPRFYDRWTSWLYTRAVRRIGRQARRIIAVSERTRRDVCDLLQVPEARVAVVPEGVPPDISSPAPEQRRVTLQRYGLADSLYVLFVGTLTERKNPLGLVEAFSQVAARIPEARLVLAGSPGPASGAVRRRLGALRLEDRALTLGHVRRPDLPALLAGAAAFVLPSFYEGFGLPVLEAMTCGTPVVVSDGGSLPEVVGEAGLVVPRAEPTALAAAITRLIEDQAARERLSRLGLARAREFSWERAAALTMAVYNDVLGT